MYIQSRALFALLSAALLIYSLNSTANAQTSRVAGSDGYEIVGQDALDDSVPEKVQGRSSDTAAAAAAASNSVNDCYGLGQIVARTLEPYIKSSENGTRAQSSIFYLLSRKKPKRNLVQIGKQFGLEWTDFQMYRDTVIIVHGYLSNGDEDWVRDMAAAYLSYADVNVIVVDWSAGSDKYNYVEAALNTQTTGNQLATLLGQISNDASSTLSSSSSSSSSSDYQRGRIHCVGHSLGSHVCGYAANEMKKRGATWLIGRITGLDPAQPCFQKVDLALRLDKGDANFVDVIHTDGRFLTELGLGFSQPIGHADFYPNGGKQQPGCAISKHKFPLITNPKQALINTICNHGRSYLYFTESLVNAAASNNCTFEAYPWDRTYRSVEKLFAENYANDAHSEMGINSEKYSYRGIFFTLTSASEPYCDVDYWDKVEIEKILKEDLKDTLED